MSPKPNELTKFEGFPEGKVRLTPVPGPFFSQLLPQIDDLNELKVVLYTFWRLDQREGVFRYVKRSDFSADAVFMAGMGATPEKAETNLDKAIGRAVARGALLEAELMLETPQTLYFLNTPKGRAAVSAIQQGRWQPSGEAERPLELGQERPNIFRLYEQNIGPLTPMLAESLNEAEEEFPPDWIEDAFRIAVENNRRNWRYIQAILRRWQEKGRDERNQTNRRDTEKDRRRYAEWEE